MVATRGLHAALSGSAPAEASPATGEPRGTQVVVNIHSGVTHSRHLTGSQGVPRGASLCGWQSRPQHAATCGASGPGFLRTLPCKSAATGSSRFEKHTPPEERDGTPEVLSSRAEGLRALRARRAGGPAV